MTAGDILIRIADLYKQATTEQSHFYTAEVLRDAAKEILDLRQALAQMRANIDRRKRDVVP